MKSFPTDYFPGPKYKWLLLYSKCTTFNWVHLKDQKGSNSNCFYFILFYFNFGSRSKQTLAVCGKLGFLEWHCRLYGKMSQHGLVSEPYHPFGEHLWELCWCSGCVKREKSVQDALCPGEQASTNIIATILHTSNYKVRLQVFENYSLSSKTILGE